MNRKLRIAIGAMTVVAAFAGADSVFAYRESRVIGPDDAISWDDTGVTPSGAWLNGGLKTTDVSVEIGTARSHGSGSHNVTMFWGCNNGTGGGVTGTFSTNGVKFARFCTNNGGVQSAVGAIDDL